MTKENRKYYIAGGIVLAASLVWMVTGMFYKKQFAPREDVRTYAQLQQQGVPMTRAVRLNSPPGFICVFGDVKALMWTAPSGPPAYLFDARGNLAAFTMDAGDSTAFQTKFRVQDGTEIPLGELPAIFASPPPALPSP